MAAFSMNESLKTLMEEVLLLTTSFEDETELQTFRLDIAAQHVSLKSVVILMRALKLMKKEGTLHTYTTGSKIILPILTPPTPQVRPKIQAFCTKCILNTDIASAFSAFPPIATSLSKCHQYEISIFPSICMPCSCHILKVVMF